MKRKYFVCVLSVILAGCGVSKPTQPPPPKTTPIAKTWTVTLSGANPPGWTFTPQIIAASSLPTGPCLGEFNGWSVPNLPASFGSCSSANAIGSTDASWTQDIVLGTTTAQLYAGETTWFAVQYGDGTHSAILAGHSAFDGSNISGQADCVSFDGGSCSWHVNFSAH